MKLEVLEAVRIIIDWDGNNDREGATHHHHTKTKNKNIIVDISTLCLRYMKICTTIKPRIRRDGT